MEKISEMDLKYLIRQLNKKNNPHVRYENTSQLCDSEMSHLM